MLGVDPLDDFDFDDDEFEAEAVAAAADAFVKLEKKFDPTAAAAAGFNIANF
jgi:hypothetical protein